MQLSIITTTVVVTIMALVVVSECCHTDKIGSLGSSTSGSSRFRGNVFRATQAGYITEVLTGVSSGTLRIVIQKASTGSTPSSATWNGVYDGSNYVSGSLTDNRAYGFNVRVEVGDMFMVGFYMETSTTYRYQSYSSSLVSGLGCITWLSGASDGSNAGTPAFFLPSSPSFPNTVYEASVIISSSPIASSTSTGVSTTSPACQAGTNGVVCSGYPCSSSCQCPSGLDSFMDTTDCSPRSSLSPSTGPFCSGTERLTLSTGSTGVVESNPIGSSYQDSTACLWELFTPFSTSRVRLSILRFETESSYDSVEIRSGSGGNFEVFGTYTGTLPQGSYFEIELCGDVAIEFTPDGSVEYSGFYIGYSVSSADSSCTPSGARDLQAAQASTTSDVSSSSSSSSSSTASASSLGSSSSSSSNSMVLIYVLPGVFLVITLVLVSVYRAYRRKGAIATRSVDYDPNDDEHADRHRKKLSGRRLKRAKGKGGKKGKKGAAKAKAAQEKRSKQGRLSEWKRRNAVELGIDEDDMDDGDDDSGATTADVDVESSAYAYEYVEHTSSDEYDEDDEDSDDAAPPSYGKATSSTVRNRFLDLGV